MAKVFFKCSSAIELKYALPLVIQLIIDIVGNVRFSKYLWWRIPVTFDWYTGLGTAPYKTDNVLPALSIPSVEFTRKMNLGISDVNKLDLHSSNWCEAELIFETASFCIKNQVRAPHSTSRRSIGHSSRIWCSSWKYILTSLPAYTLSSSFECLWNSGVLIHAHIVQAKVSET